MKENLETTIYDYEHAVKWLGQAGDDKSSSVFLLIDRDEIKNNFSLLNNEQISRVEQADNILKQKAGIIANALPTPSSTPQARAEGRWWWFLNETQIA